MEQRTEPQWLEEGDKEEFGGQRGGWGTKGRSSKQRTTEPTTNVEEGRRTMIAVALAMTMENENGCSPWPFCGRTSVVDGRYGETKADEDVVDSSCACRITILWLLYCW
jgi:hypothetical protein